MTDQKQLVDVEYYNDFVTLVTSNARCTRGIKSRISVAKAAFVEQKMVLFSPANWTKI